MKQLIIICEGPTEKAFCQEILYDRLMDKGVLLTCVLPVESGGGIVNWHPLRKQIGKAMGATCYVTTFIDYYKLKQSYPNYEQALQCNSPELIEEGMYKEVGNSRFIPYIQIHEFEALLFCDIAPFVDRFDTKDVERDEIEKIIRDYPNPEMINHGEMTAPSKRLERHIRKYDKIIDGKAIASKLGLDVIMERCPHFKSWIEKLENI